MYIYILLYVNGYMGIYSYIGLLSSQVRRVIEYESCIIENTIFPNEILFLLFSEIIELQMVNESIKSSIRLSMIPIFFYETKRYHSYS